MSIECCFELIFTYLFPVLKLLSSSLESQPHDLLDRFAFHVDQAKAAGHGPEEPKKLVAWV
jgi:hypothetical protein